MTDTNQKLREHLREVIAYARESGHDWLCLVEAEQALALPTADHIPDAGEMVADHLPDAGKMIETAAPMGEREAIYRCTNCKHIYQAEPPTQCDCMPDVQWYEQGYASFDGATLPTQQSPVDGLPEIEPVAKASKGPVAFFVKWTECGKPLRGEIHLCTVEQAQAYATAAVQQFKDRDDEHIHYLAQIRDAVAEMCPGESEGLLMQAIGGPCEVPGYVIEVMQHLKVDAERWRATRTKT